MNQQSSWQERLILQLITFAVIGNGLVIIAATLANQLHPRNGHLLNDIVVTLPLISGLTLVYLGTLLHRRKQAAWGAVVPLYAFILGGNVIQFAGAAMGQRPELFIRSIFLPLSVVTVLIVFSKVFTVKSAIQNFNFPLRIIAIMAIIIAAYGVSGYLLLDHKDFGQEISVPQAFQHTVDQFDFTTDFQLIPHTRRATVFVDSLNILSAVAVGYIVISLFQPLRAKLHSQTNNRLLALGLITDNSNDSEDFFKLWPQDKTYFFNSAQSAALAYRIQSGMALVVGDPIGDSAQFGPLLDEFSEFCRPNDWQPTLIHTSEELCDLYESKGLQTQKIGEEAVVQVSTFLETTIKDKYFRQINNKFQKHGYSITHSRPPHSQAVLDRLRRISSQWLAIPGRQERGFMMGYHSNAYLQQCNILLARDQNGVIQGFLNQVPSYQSSEANFDLLRQGDQALGNINDFLLMDFIKQAQVQGFRTVNLGLCPGSGLGTAKAERNVINSAMRLLYTKGSRFYSSAGLRRFKAKYEPNWRSRYVAYKGGVRGFSKSAYGLNKALNRTR